MKSFPPTRRGRRWLHMMLCLMMMCCLFPFPASAANGDPVQTISNPANTNIDVFDYWVYDAKGNSTIKDNNRGINYDNHTLWFWGSTNNSHGTENNWTGYTGGVTQNLVQRQLVDGYPVLNFGSRESLAYLFNHEDIDVEINGNTLPAKETHTDASELFTVDEDGYYYFNSEIHKAKLNTETGDFDVTQQSNGMFFPFSDAEPDRCFFGVHMQTEFSVPNDGLVLNPSGQYQEMVYEFSGDDDVWVFIDGILIGDVGGIHSAQDLSINFATGEVKVKNHQYGNNVHETTIYDMVVAAIGEEAAQEQFRWKVEEDGSIKTYASGTYHTLDFFYLERGAGRSNMKIRYNLVSTYDFTAHKTLYKGGSDGEETLKENQFQYKLTGYAILDEDGNVLLPAVMPVSAPDQDVIWIPDYDHEPQTLIVGNAVDGNINYGDAQLEGERLERYVGKTFRYVYEELIPDGAILNADGTYSLNGITYDTKKFYFEGTVSPEGWINKTYYTDETFTQKANVDFVNFTNYYNSTGKSVLAAQKSYLSALDEPLPMEVGQFSCKLTNITDAANPVVIAEAVGNDGSGKFTFPEMMFSLANDMTGGVTNKTYTYRIEENPGSDPSISYTDQTYYAQVILTDDGDGSLIVETKYYYDEACTEEIQESQVIFVNTNTQVGKLTVSKQVGGNIGSKDQSFAFELAAPDYADMTIQYSMDDETGVREIQLDADGKATFSLAHGQTITFHAFHGSYVIQESNGAYAASYQINNGTITAGNQAQGTVAGNEEEVAFINELEASPPTGVLDSVTPAWIGIGTGIALLTIVWLERRKRGYE
ncbi:MAG: hypothetical protein IJ573_07185 [Clostridia bacterium]|nr:hypothetical protein [Clostridia bacterium]MBR1408658.1 hypothetical protein [Clostridia bacterium]